MLQILASKMITQDVHQHFIPTGSLNLQVQVFRSTGNEIKDHFRLLQLLVCSCSLCLHSIQNSASNHLGFFRPSSVECRFRSYCPQLQKHEPSVQGRVVYIRTNGSTSEASALISRNFTWSVWKAGPIIHLSSRVSGKVVVGMECLGFSVMCRPLRGRESGSSEPNIRTRGEGGAVDPSECRGDDGSLPVSDDSGGD